MSFAANPRPFQPDRENLARPLAGPFMTFDLVAESEALRRETAYQRNRHNARTLAKYADLRIVLEVAQEGARLTTHEPDERIAVQVLRGRLRVRAGDATIEVAAGHLAALDKATAHQMEALEDSAFLIYVSWPVARDSAGA